MNQEIHKPMSRSEAFAILDDLDVLINARYMWQVIDELRKKCSPDLVQAIMNATGEVIPSEGKKKRQEKGDIPTLTVTAPREEWKEVERLVTAYRQQCRSQRHYTERLERLTRFQQRLTQKAGTKPPDDYFI